MRWRARAVTLVLAAAALVMIAGEAHASGSWAVPRFTPTWSELSGMTRAFAQPRRPTQPRAQAPRKAAPPRDEAPKSRLADLAAAAARTETATAARPVPMQSDDRILSISEERLAELIERAVRSAIARLESERPSDPETPDVPSEGKQKAADKKGKKKEKDKDKPPEKKFDERRRYWWQED